MILSIKMAASYLLQTEKPNESVRSVLCLASTVISGDKRLLLDQPSRWDLSNWRQFSAHRHLWVTHEQFLPSHIEALMAP